MRIFFTNEPPNGERYAPAGYWWPGRDNVTLMEPTPSHANCLTAKRAQTPTTMAPAHFAGDRVHAVLGGNLA